MCIFVLPVVQALVTRPAIDLVDPASSVKLAAFLGATELQHEHYLRLRPYHVESTGTRPISEVKQRRAWGVLRWVTTWES